MNSIKTYEDKIKMIIQLMLNTLKIEYSEELFFQIYNDKININNKFIFNNLTKTKPKEKEFVDFDPQFTDKSFLKVAQELKNDSVFNTEKHIFYMLFCNIQINNLISKNSQN